MHVTVAICTWNRAALLDQTLTQMRLLKVPAGHSWELLVVNNNSSDETDAVLAQHCASLPLRRLFEPAQGHSNARNRALSEATGDLLIWTDDDVLVDSNWLAAYCAAARDWPEAGVFGGRIEPMFESPPPRWVVENLDLVEGPLAVYDLGTQTREMSTTESPMGASMAFRRSAYREMWFDPKLGRQGEKLISGDDTEMVERARQRGFGCVWVADALVRHHVPTKRLTTRYVWDWFLGAGLTTARRGGVGGKRLFGVARHLLRAYATARLRAFVSAPRRSRAWLLAYRRAAYSLGQIQGSRRTEATLAQTVA